MTEKPLHLSRAAHLPSRLVRNLRERTIEVMLFLAAFSSVATTVAILFILVTESLTFFKEVHLAEFLTDTQWTPLFADAHYGILPLISGTLVTTVVALLVAVPLGTIAAIYLSEFAAPALREVVKPCLELLAGVPTVVYGYLCAVIRYPVATEHSPRFAWF